MRPDFFYQTFAALSAGDSSWGFASPPLAASPLFAAICAFICRSSCIHALGLHAVSLDLVPLRLQLSLLLRFVFAEQADAANAFNKMRIKNGIRMQTM